MVATRALRFAGVAIVFVLDSLIAFSTIFSTRLLLTKVGMRRQQVSFWNQFFDSVLVQLALDEGYELSEVSAFNSTRRLSINSTSLWVAPFRRKFSRFFGISAPIKNIFRAVFEAEFANVWKSQAEIDDLGLMTNVKRLVLRLKVPMIENPALSKSCSTSSGT